MTARGCSSSASYYDHAEVERWSCAVRTPTLLSWRTMATVSTGPHARRATGLIGGPLTIWEKGSLGWYAVQVFWFLLGSRYGRRPNPTPDSNPNPNPDPKPQPKRAKNSQKRGCAAFASNQSQTTIPKCRPRYAFFKSKTSLKVPSPRLLNLLADCGRE